MSHKANSYSLSYATLLAIAAANGPIRTEPLDQTLARQSLTKCLEAWRLHETAESLLASSNPIIMADPDWAAGHALIRYEISEDTTQRGKDTCIQVKLWIDGVGYAPPSVVRYCIGGKSQITVVRGLA